MPAIELGKFQSLVTKDSTVLLDQVLFAASPYERWKIDWNRVRFVSTGRARYPNQTTLIEGYGSKATTQDPNRTNDPLWYARKELKLISAEGSNGGWTFQWIMKGAPSQNTNLKGGTGIAAFVECSSASAEVYQPIASARIVGIIDTDNGVQAVVGPDDETYTLITAHTPNLELSKIKLPRLPYMRTKEVKEEEAAWDAIRDQLIKYKSDLGSDRFYLFHDYLGKDTNPYLPKAGSIYDILGYVPEGFNDPNPVEGGSTEADYSDMIVKVDQMIADIETHHPIGGFANYRDEWTAKPGELMEYVTPNYTHFLNKVTPQHILLEVLQNHVRANGQPLLRFFGCDFNPDVITGYEPGVVVLDAGPGSVQDIIVDSTSHGRFRYWWSADSKMYYIHDYTVHMPVGTTNALNFAVSKDMSCTLKVTLTYGTTVINRVCVRGQWAAGIPDTPGDPLDNYFAQAQGSVYPAGRKPGDTEGSDIVMEDFQGTNTAEEAMRIYKQANCVVTAEIINFPFAPVVFHCFNRLVSITATDPYGSFSFTNKLFVCEAASYNYQDYDSTGGGYATGNMSLREVRTDL